MTFVLHVHFLLPHFFASQACDDLQFYLVISAMPFCSDNSFLLFPFGKNLSLCFIFNNENFKWISVRLPVLMLLGLILVSEAELVKVKKDI